MIIATMMVNLCVNFTALQGAQIKHYFWVCLWGCFCMKSAFESVDSVDCPPQGGWASSNLLRAWIEQKAEEGRICLFFFLICLVELGHWSSSAPRLGFTPLPPLVLRPSDSGWNYTTGFPGSPACRWQIMGLLSLHNHVSQPLIIKINLSLSLFSPSLLIPIGSVSLENPN